ncbi:helix-turn-helix domain-containing protein [Clostridioides difficile]
MNKNLFSIGEVSKIKEITIKTLRYYHKIGILIPKFIDDNTGYRYYSIDQFIYIDIIKGFRALGTSISELQDIFKNCDMDELLDFLDKKREEAEENIKKMQIVINNIDILTQGIRHSRNLANINEIRTDFFDERIIIFVPCNEVGELKELLYYSDLDKEIKNNNVNPTLERGILYKVSSKNTPESMYAFNVIEPSTNLNNKCNISILPKGKYLTLTYSRDTVDQCEKLMVNYLKENNLNAKEWLEVELFNNLFETESYNCQIQVLIE